MHKHNQWVIAIIAARAPSAGILSADNRLAAVVRILRERQRLQPGGANGQPLRTANYHEQLTIPPLNQFFGVLLCRALTLGRPNCAREGKKPWTSVARREATLREFGSGSRSIGLIDRRGYTPLS
jgi:hypothetical protein